MNRVEHFQARKLTAQVEYRTANIGKRGAEVFPPVRRQQNVMAEAARGLSLQFSRREMQRIDDGVSGEMHMRGIGMFGEYVFERALGRAEMQLREPRYRDA